METDVSLANKRPSKESDTRSTWNRRRTLKGGEVSWSFSLVHPTLEFPHHCAQLNKLAYISLQHAEVPTITAQLCVANKIKKKRQNHSITNTRYTQAQKHGGGVWVTDFRSAEVVPSLAPMRARTKARIWRSFASIMASHSKRRRDSAPLPARVGVRWRGGTRPLPRVTQITQPRRATKPAPLP